MPSAAVAKPNGVSTFSEEPEPLPIEEVELRLAKPKGWKCWVTFDIDWRTVDALRSTNTEDMRAAIPGMVTRWNFVDRFGAPIPQPSEGGVDHLPIWVLTELMTAYNQAMTKRVAVPNA
jgi:hypothetical protein